MSEQKIIQGDCSEVMKTFEDSCIDLTVTSPPYDNLRDYEGFSFDFEGIARELFRVTKDGGVVVWVVADATVDGSETGTSFKQALFFKEIGFNIHDTMIWIKGQLPFPSSNRYHQAFEYMFVFSKGTPKTFRPILDRRNSSFGRSSIVNSRKKDGSIERGEEAVTIREFCERFNYWEMFNQTRGGENEHPAIFPEKLAADHIISWSKEGDLILDPFNGSGTTTKMAKHLNRQFIGIDISEKYCEIAKSRLAQDLLF